MRFWFCSLLLLLCATPADSQDYLELPILAEDREHWSFRPIVRPDLPEVQNDAWSKNPIDMFIFAKLSQANLSPMPAASHNALVRRLYLDLTGLAPIYDEVITDRHYEQLVDELLNSPRFG